MVEKINSKNESSKIFKTWTSGNIETKLKSLETNRVKFYRTSPEMVNRADNRGWRLRNICTVRNSALRCPCRTKESCLTSHPFAWKMSNPGGKTTRWKCTHRWLEHQREPIKMAIQFRPPFSSDRSSLVSLTRLSCTCHLARMHDSVKVLLKVGWKEWKRKRLEPRLKPDETIVPPPVIYTI